MKWNCPDILKYQNLFLSEKEYKSKDYANKMKELFPLYSSKTYPGEKFVIVKTIFDISNPLYEPKNLLDYLASWIKDKKWDKNMKIDYEEKKVTTTATFNVANHYAFYRNAVDVNATMSCHIIDNKQLMVAFTFDTYKNSEYTSTDYKPARQWEDKVCNVYPFSEKGGYKNTYAEAFTGAHKKIWAFITVLNEDLNTKFANDKKMINQLHYEYACDSLTKIYGCEPTKVIADKEMEPCVNNELRFYEGAKKLVFMGKTVSFNDIISVEIDDDPQFIPGATRTYGAGICFFGFGFYSGRTVSEASKTIHNYVVNVKIDNLKCPFIHIATGGNEPKANELCSAFEYLIRHQTKRPANIKRTGTTRKKRK